MPDIKNGNLQGKKIFGKFDFVAIAILLPPFFIVCSMDEMFYENIDVLRLTLGAVLLVYAIKKLFTFCIYLGDGTLANLIAAATSMFLSYLFMFPLATILHLQVTNQLREYLFLLLVLTYVIYNIFYSEKLKPGNTDLNWKEWLAKLIKLFLKGVVAGVAMLLALKLIIALVSFIFSFAFSLINISVSSFFNLFGAFLIWMLFWAFFL